MSTESAMALATTGTSTPAQPPMDAVSGTNEAPTMPKELESTRFSNLAKKEAELVRQREEFKKEREQVLADKESLRPIHERLKKFEELKAKDPVAAIKFLEFSDTDLINFIFAQQDNSTPEEKARKAAQEEIARFTAEQKKKDEDYRSEQNNKVISEFKGSIKKAITTDQDKYELSNKVGSAAEELAYEFVAECVKAGTEAPTAEEAADMVESYYENYFKEIMTSKKLTKKEAIEVVQRVDEPLKAEVNPRPQTPAKTLSNKATATVASTVTRRETPSEKRERLIQMLRNGG